MNIVLECQIGLHITLVLQLLQEIERHLIVICNLAGIEYDSD